MSNQIKHTPGPWRIAGDGQIIGCSTTDTTEEKIVVALTNKELWNKKDERIANARLIAAAPELLEVLKSLEKYLEGLGSPYNHRLLGLREVIAKADGK